MKPIRSLLYHSTLILALRLVLTPLLFGLDLVLAMIVFGLGPVLVLDIKDLKKTKNK